MPSERNPKKRNSLRDALSTLRPTLRAPSSAPLPKPKRSPSSTPRIAAKAAASPATSSSFPGGAPLSLAVRRQVLSTARAYLSEKRHQRTPGDRMGFRCAVLASRRTSKASRFIRNLKENSIEQKLIAMQNRIAAREDGEESSSGPDQMLEEACQLAVQLQQLSNHDCINEEISKIAESITVCTELLNNLRASGLSHTLHLEQITQDLNSVEEGHGISKALLQELQQDIAAMRSAIESMTVASGTVAPVAPRGPTTSVDTAAESMAPLLDDLEERTTLLISEMGEGDCKEKDEESVRRLADFVVEKVASAADIPLEFSGYEVATCTTESGHTGLRSDWEELLSETASRWIAQDSHDDFDVAGSLDGPKSADTTTWQSATSRGQSGRAAGEAFDHVEDGGFFSQAAGYKGFHFKDTAESFGGSLALSHWDPSQQDPEADHPSYGALPELHGAGRQRGLEAEMQMQCHQEDQEDLEQEVAEPKKLAKSGAEQMDERMRNLPSYFQAEGNGGRLPRLLHGGAEKIPGKTAPSHDGYADVQDVHPETMPSPFFPQRKAAPVHGGMIRELEESEGYTTASESSLRTSEADVFLGSVDLPFLLDDLRGRTSDRRSIGTSDDVPAGGRARERWEWSLQGLTDQEWELMAACLHCPGHGAELRQRLLEPVACWPPRIASATPVGPVGPILLNRNERKRRASASVSAAAKMASYLKQKRRSSLPHLLGLVTPEAQPS